VITNFRVFIIIIICTFILKVFYYCRQSDDVWNFQSTSDLSILMLLLSVCSPWII
jgi:uncharacterized membrane protein